MSPAIAPTAANIHPYDCNQYIANYIDDNDCPLGMHPTCTAGGTDRTFEPLLVIGSGASASVHKMNKMTPADNDCSVLGAGCEYYVDVCSHAIGNNVPVKTYWRNTDGDQCNSDAGGSSITITVTAYPSLMESLLVLVGSQMQSSQGFSGGWFQAPLITGPYTIVEDVLCQTTGDTAAYDYVLEQKNPNGIGLWRSNQASATGYSEVITGVPNFGTYTTPIDMKCVTQGANTYLWILAWSPIAQKYNVFTYSVNVAFDTGLDLLQGVNVGGPTGTNPRDLGAGPNGGVYVLINEDTTDGTIDLFKNDGIWSDVSLSTLTAKVGGPTTQGTLSSDPLAANFLGIAVASPTTASFGVYNGVAILDMFPTLSTSGKSISSLAVLPGVNTLLVDLAADGAAPKTAAFGAGSWTGLTASCPEDVISAGGIQRINNGVADQFVLVSSSLGKIYTYPGSGTSCTEATSLGFTGIATTSSVAQSATTATVTINNNYASFVTEGRAQVNAETATGNFGGAAYFLIDPDYPCQFDSDEMVYLVTTADGKFKKDVTSLATDVVVAPASDHTYCYKVTVYENVDSGKYPKTPATVTGSFTTLSSAPSSCVLLGGGCAMTDGTVSMDFITPVGATGYLKDLGSSYGYGFNPPTSAPGDYDDVFGYAYASASLTWSGKPWFDLDGEDWSTPTTGYDWATAHVSYWDGSSWQTCEDGGFVENKIELGHVIECTFTGMNDPVMGAGAGHLPAGGGAVCGNSIVEAGEQCDDGNTDNGDCCSSTCQFEALASACTDSTPLDCQKAECDGAGTCDQNHANQINGFACDSGGCLGGETCNAGLCGGGTTEECCSNGINDDGDGAKDCMDIADCAADPICGGAGVCGDLVCNAGEDCAGCPADCGPGPCVGGGGTFCGDLACNGVETCSTCARDCGLCAAVSGGRVYSAPAFDLLGIAALMALAVLVVVIVMYRRE